jgi:DNA-binding CsgD family transcriptional regulator
MADPVILAQSLNRVGNWYTNIARPLDGYALHREALGIVEESDDRRAIAETLDLLGIACYVAGNPTDCMEYYTTAVERFGELGDRQGVSWCLSILALCGGNYQTDAGPTAPLTFDACERYAGLAIDAAREIGWRPGEAFAMHVYGIACMPTGLYDRAYEMLRGSLAIAEEIEHRQWTTAGKCSLGAFYLDLLALERARQYLEDALAGARAMGSRLWVLSTSPQLAETYILSRDFSAAQAVLDAVNLDDIRQSQQGGRSCWIALASLHLAQANPEEALRIVDELIATAPHLKSERDAPRLARLRGETLAALGRLSDAEMSLRAAVESAALQGWPAYGWRAQVALGRVLRMQRRHADADVAFAAARETIDRLAAQVPEPEVRQTFLLSATALLPRPRPKTARQAAAQAYGGLTAREREVAALVAQGLSNRAIADQLIVSEPTVATHISHVLSKLGFSSRTQIATWALEVDLLRDA